MPALIAAPWLGTAIAGIAGGTGAVVAAKMGSNAASNAAATQTSAANHAADVQAQSARDTLEFQRQQATRDQENFNTTQRANYDQWAAGSGNEYNAYVSSLKNDRNAVVAGGHNDYNKWSARDRRIGKLGEMLGLGQRDTPAYEEIAPLDIPTLNTPAYAGPGGSGSGGSGQAFDPEYIKGQVNKVYADYGTQATGPGTGPTDIAYMTDAIRKNKGWEPYWQTRIVQELQKAGIKPNYQGTAASMLG